MKRILCVIGLLLGVIHTISCTTVIQPGIVQNDYVPKFERFASGFRPLLPLYLADVSYLSSQYLSESELTDIQRNFARPLYEGPYKQHIAAITVFGSYEPAQTQFSVWLHDGRRLDSGALFFDRQDQSISGFSQDNLGRPMLERATKILQKAIPESRREADLRTLEKRPN